MQFLYGDGLGHIVDEHGVEPMDLVVDEELFAIEAISSRTQFLMNKPPERPVPVTRPVVNGRNDEDIDMELCNNQRYRVYSDEDKTIFFHLFSSKCLYASAAARQLGIHSRAAQRWAKRYYEDLESIFEKKKS
ncbi:hypothetical protein G6F57_001401 [Rhizopus arrhizus]|uniref:Uncharacterized protein n=1 Tax=Rhizopus oryzae TaxID=64495 RepID=A0A9P6WXF3_RHIOR|nr:hypothetical protein G6F23_011679 [Rhizopus arrhizus]KAG1428878.1 hypothetical protein G6F58_000337 [Rhizopus delemar]KAG0768315.1 hypothetical protein G6F24_002038 [Rhizopus arrhizus]KAG0776879.1 hypothetical protein G6F22_012258 [Rhizopus arrhizus]KAG0796232.1 hypothetical protein G6F21_001467 [Rhizopus arrhizus]